MNVTKLMSRIFEVVAFIIGVLAIYYLFVPEAMIIAITLMLLMHFPLFIANRLEAVYSS